jgi:hypothetical protein
VSALAGVVAGCSLVGIEPPPKEATANVELACTSSRTLPGIDTAVAVVTGIVGVGFLLLAGLARIPRDLERRSRRGCIADASARSSSACHVSSTTHAAC